MTALYTRIGEDMVREAITEFYRRAFTDGIIGHFFFNADRAHITAMQIDFATAMLGGPRRYRGKSLRDAHKPFSLRKPHFDRRQVLMRDVLEDLNVDPGLAQAWLALEEQLRPLIVNAIPAHD